MILFGRMETQERWAAVDPFAVDGYLRSLYHHLFDEEVPYAKREIVFTHEALPQPIAAADFKFEFVADDLTGQDSAITWISQNAHAPGADWVRTTLTTSDGAVIGGFIVRARRACRAEEIGRALEASFDSGFERAGRYAVLDTQRLPKPQIRKLSSGVKPSVMGEFLCENPICASGGDKLYIPLSTTELNRHQAGSLLAPAYPCPFCPGDDSQRWALSFNAKQTSDSAQPGPDAKLLRYPVAPFFPA